MNYLEKNKIGINSIKNSLLVADTTLALDNPLYFRKNLIERI